MGVSLLFRFLPYCIVATFLLASVSCKDESEQNECKVIVGIDLGTTYSCVGVFRNGRVDIFQNDQGNRITPSYVAFTQDGSRLIGDSAKNQLASNPENTVFDAKRLIGRKFDDSEVQEDLKYLPFKVVNIDGVLKIKVKIDNADKFFLPEEISAMVLRKMKEVAEKGLDTNVSCAVITVPAYFTDSQRVATSRAGAIAGLKVERIINEPTAAAIAYGLNKQDGEKTVLIFDLGGGTYDVSVLTVDSGVFEVIATSGNTHLGGQDFDNNVVKYCVDYHKKTEKVDISKNKKAMQRLRRAAERAKRMLSKHHKTTVELENPDGEGSVPLSVPLTRAKFEELNMNLFRSTVDPIKKVLKDAGLKKTEIDEVVLVGGSSRIPKVQQILKEFFDGKEPNKGIHPDEAVAYGAAVQGGILSGAKEASHLVLLDVTPLTLGIETQGGVMTKIVPRNTRIPVKKTQTFTTVQNSQTEVEIKVLEGERGMAKDNHLLDSFKLTGIKAAPRGVPQIEVTFEYNNDGILLVSASEKSSNRQEKISIKGSGEKFSAEEIERMVNEAETYAEDDKKAKEKAEAKIQLEHSVHSVKDAIDDKTKVEGKLSPEELETAKKETESALSWISSNPDASAEDFKKRKEEFDSALKDIVPKISQAQSGGGEKQQKPESSSEQEKTEEDTEKDEL